MNKGIYLCVFALLSLSAQANLEKDMESFFKHIGGGNDTHTNVTPGGAYKGQEGGFYTGGSIFARTPAREVQMMNVQLPRVEAGCNGIDVFTGGLGFVNGRRFIETLKSIGANASGYAFSLAVKQMSPQIMNQIEEMLSVANSSNWNNINSCQKGMSLINNSAALFHESWTRTCIQNHLSNKTTGDYIDARDLCKAQKEINEQNKAAKSNPALKDGIVNDVNIVWRALKKNGGFAKLDNELLYFLMSLTGTIIIRADPPATEFYVSKLYKKDIIEYLATHKSVEVYACQDEHKDENGCLALATKTITLAGNKNFFGRVTEILKKMEDKVEKDEALTDAEKAFLEATALPVYKMLNIHSAFSKGVTLMLPSEYAEVIAMDILYRYVDTGINDVMQAYSNNDLPQELRGKFDNMLALARRQIRDLRTHHLKKMAYTQDMIARVQMMEKQISALISSEHFNDFEGG